MYKVKDLNQRTMVMAATALVAITIVVVIMSREPAMAQGAVSFSLWPTQLAETATAQHSAHTPTAVVAVTNTATNPTLQTTQMQTPSQTPSTATPSGSTSTVESSQPPPAETTLPPNLPSNTPVITNTLVPTSTVAQSYPQSPNSNPPLPGASSILTPAPSMQSSSTGNAGEVVQLALGGGNKSQACAAWLVYSTNQTGDWEIFRLGNIPGEPEANINLSQGIGTDDIGMSLSPDKAFVAFASNRNGNFEIYVAASDGVSQTRITNHPNATSTGPVWSVDGHSIVYSSNFGGEWDLYMLNIASRQEKRLTNGTGSFLNARFAPDGKGIIFESVVDFTSQIYHLDLTTMHLTKLSDGQGNDRNPTYSPDGTKIAFNSFRSNLNSVLFIMDADGSNVTAVSDTKVSAVNHSWSPDGTLIAYQAQNNADLAIYVYQLSTKNTRRVTDLNSVNYAPTWYCNSTTLVFTSNVTGNPNLFSTTALPMEAQSISVDKLGRELTSVKNAAAQFAEDSPHEQNASNLGPPAPSLVLPALGGISRLKCGDITRMSVVGGSLEFPLIDTNAC